MFSSASGDCVAFCVSVAFSAYPKAVGNPCKNKSTASMKACKSCARISHRTPRHVPTTPSTQQSWELCDMRCVFFCPTRHSRNATQTVHWSYTSCGAYCRFLLHSQLGKPNTGPNKTSCSPTEICSCIHHMSSMSHWQTSSTDLDAKNSARTSRLPAETPGRPAASETTDAHCAQKD